jgi:hypothetical protein
MGKWWHNSGSPAPSCPHSRSPEAKAEEADGDWGWEQKNKSGNAGQPQLRVRGNVNVEWRADSDGVVGSEASRQAVNGFWRMGQGGINLASHIFLRVKGTGVDNGRPMEAGKQMCEAD